MNSIVAALLFVTVAGGMACAGRQALITSTGTNIGVDIAQSPTTQTPHAKLGYQRVEVAIVPTNRSALEDAGDKGGGAADHGEVLMELRYGGIFDLGATSGIYQRLAVGSTAVRQPGAAYMFARDAAGNLNSDVTKSLESIPAPTAGISAGKILVATAYRSGDPSVKERVTAAVKAQGYDSYDFFIDNRPSEPSAEQMTKILDQLKNDGLIPK